MAKDYNDSDGRWVTINGRRVFIAEGQSLGDAMKKSGKFEKKGIKGKAPDSYIDSKITSKDDKAVVKDLERRKEQLKQRKNRYTDEEYKKQEKGLDDGIKYAKKGLNKKLEPEDISTIATTTNSINDTYGYAFNKMLDSANREGLKVKDVKVGIAGENKAKVEFENGAKLNFYDLKNGKAIINDANRDDFDKIEKALNSYRVASRSEDVKYDFDKNEWVNQNENTKVPGMNNDKYDKKYNEHLDDEYDWRFSNKSDYEKEVAFNKAQKGMSKEDAEKEAWERAEKETKELLDMEKARQDETSSSGAKEYYSKLNEKDIAKDLEERKNRLDNGFYDKGDEKKYKDFYEEGKEYYNNKYGKKYDSVTDRYDKDQKFRNTLKKEHDKTLDATRKEVQSYLQDKEYFEKNGVESIDDLYNQINDNYYNVDRKDFDKIVKEETSKGSSFTQHTDMHGGTYEYSKEQLDRMQESGMKPMKHSYTGGGWEGTKYDSKLTTKDIAKNINDYSKKEFPDVKLSRKTDYNSMDIHIMSSDKDLYMSPNDIDRMSDEQVSDAIRDSIGGVSRFDDWLNENNKKSSNGTYTTNEQREYLKNQLNSYKNRTGDNVTGNEWYLSDYGKKVVSGLNKEMNSYNYDDSDGMVDYFNTNFYGYVKIGKWDKPYESKQSQSPNKLMNDAIREKAGKTKADRNIDAMDDKETRRRVAEASNKEIKQILAENQKQKNNEYISKVVEESGKNKESGVIQRAVSRMTPQQKAKTFEARLRQRGQDLDEERAYYTQDRMNKIIDKQNMSDKAKASARQNLNTWKPAKNDQELRNRYSEDMAYDKGATPNASKNDTRHLNSYKKVELNRIKNMLSGEKVYDTRNGKNVGDARNLKEDKESTNKIMNNAIRNKKVTQAYQNYIKKHPNSKITLSEFKDLYQG